MNVLVTSSRFPHALAEIRRLGEGGHRVFAADTFRAAPGSHSRHATEAFRIPSPRFETARFLAELDRIVVERQIDLVVPTFEEALYLAAHNGPSRWRSFAPPLPTLRRLHDKGEFALFAAELGLRVPGTRIVRNDAELRAALKEIPLHVARPVFSRGGVRVLANAGPLAGAVHAHEVHPTIREPWIVQDLVHGTDVCSFSVARHGKLTAHVAYEHPRTIDAAGGIYLESVDGRDSMAIAKTIVEATGYHGQISFDFIREAEGLTLIECNPRPTNGVFLMPSWMLCDAIWGDPTSPHLAPPGNRTQIAFALLRDLLRHHENAAEDLAALLSGAEDAYAARGDRMPALWCLLSYAQVLRYRHRAHHGRRERADLVEAQFYDVLWDGDGSPSTLALPSSRHEVSR